jgi:hypothetical protein
MAEKQELATSTEDSFVILAQIFGAFGFGAGGMLVTPEVVVRAAKDYREVIQLNAKRWNLLELPVLESARMTGRLAAERALREERIRITLNDYERAVKTVLPMCPFRHPHS